MISFELIAVIALVILAFGDLVVGVINDAVNFLNSAIGSKVTSQKVIFIVASIGIIFGATFSDGIIEVARNGIFHPTAFSVSEVITIFAAVALADIILLDFYSTFGLPTSTTVSVVFELLGAALIMALWKTGDFTDAWTVINGDSATKIIVGIVLSVGIAFMAGLIAQFITRLLFTFDYKKRLKSFGFLWSGAALTCLVFFILIKGGSHATFMTDSLKEWVANNTKLILGVSFLGFSAFSWLSIRLNKNILKFIVLIGTASLAMAFAGNDLANFIGVSVGGVNAYLRADLAGKLPTPTWVVVIAGLVMSGALFISKKAQTVTKTTIDLSSHSKEVKGSWGNNIIFVKIVDLVTFLFELIKKIIPGSILNWMNSRWHRSKAHQDDEKAFDLLRASVNLMVAAAVISYATSQKLPLSTTYVTFMVAMGSALGDGAWRKDCGPSRIAGVLAVIAGWFGTALGAFVLAGIAVSILYFTKSYGLIGLLLVVILSTYKLMHVHKRKTA